LTVSLLRLQVRDLRCLAEVDLEPGETNLIVGENASGKTSLLEAIFVLGRGRSFRVAGRSGLIRDECEEAVVSGRAQRGERRVPLGIALQRGGGSRIRVDGRDESSAASLASWLPVQVIDPGVHRLVDESPGVRRRYLDWGVFHVEQGFLDGWRRYHRILRQRNAALKSSSGPTLATWDRQLVEAGEVLSDYRRAYLEALAPDVEAVCRELLGLPVRLSYRQGWPEGRDLPTALEEARARDRRQGVTHPGPHRADIGITFDDQPARGRVSRGQQKLLAAGLVLGQLRHLQRHATAGSVLLLDDMAAELDEARLARFLKVVVDLGVQLFVTALTPDAIPLPKPHRLFHVEQGKLRSVV
jgi:DNA replication and repair protein RecF